MAPSPSSSTTSVQVALRIRPTTTQDTTSIPARFQRTVIHATSATSVTVEASNAAPALGTAAPTTVAAKKQVFTFDQVHPPNTTQHALFKSTAEPLISRFVEGFNCTILAYGQTSSGKTFTMTGIDLDADPSDPSNGMGIVPRAVSTIFARARQLKEERGSAWNFSIKGSFIEIYNEDLIDLLSMDDGAGGRREVQIREDKDGTIIWGGLREVSVRNTNEVMSLIRKGTSIRRTNETEMNAQSSRSHAIFSLTLTQKKFVGSGLPPRSSSPLPPAGRSPSRLARPGSVYTGSATVGRTSSPTLGRPPTPSFATAMGRGGSTLRPSSALGHTSERPTTAEEAGEWVTIISKFHFVDLAGSERLKRTAAAGERIKEGISINSGLLALGNVISALGDPARAKSHTATHIPYRDSKLTRLLQDSLGGNAHTLMIACISPAEWNANETVNTLKYANRARNIKNRAVLNEREDGWDDVEWLQGMVTRLRKDLKILKEGGAIPELRSNSDNPALEGAGKKVLAQMTELQNNYEDLRGKYVDRTEELTRLRRELGDKHRSSTGGAITGTGKYEEIVGPVIEEYEKTISAMEAELSLNRAALRHTNEMVEEKEDELAAITERHAATELYVEELRSRVAKLNEREASTEAYVRDLEEKLKTYDETSISSTESMSDLKREVSRFKDAESQSGKYIAELEARLARSDESVLELQRMVEKLEKECDRRRDEVEMLQSRLKAIQQDGESWRIDLEERERRVKELEARMEQWERKKAEAGETRNRLGTMVGEVAQARRSLELDLAGAHALNGSSSASPTDSPLMHTNGVSSTIPEEPPTPTRTELSLESQLLTLQQTHTATLADLSSVTSKYRDALREISDLAGQIQELKISSSPVSESPIGEKDMSPRRRRLTGSRSRELSEPQINGNGRRPFFRQAASAESLHSRSLSQSLSLSQELSSARSRKASFSSHGTSSSHSPSHSHSTYTSIAGSRPSISISGNSERSVASLETEIMRLQDVLKEREAEIGVLEESLKASQQKPQLASPTSSSTDSRPSTPEANGNHPISSYLSPKTIGQFEHIRRSMVLHGRDHLDNGSEQASSVSEADDSLDRLNELMLSMAQKEAQHKEMVDGLDGQLSSVRRQLEDLTTLSRDQAINMSTEMESLRSKHAADLATLESVQQHEAELIESLKRAESMHADAIDKLRMDHEAALKAKGVEVDGLISSMKLEHDTTLAALRTEISEASATIEKLQKDHKLSLDKLKADHESELHRRSKDAEEVLESTKKSHDATLSKLTREHAELLKQKEAEAASTLQTTEEEYYNALTKLRSDHAASLEVLAAEHNAALDRLREEHAGALRIAEITQQGSIAASESSKDTALRELQEEHAAAIARKESSLSEELEQLKAEHSRALTRQAEDLALQQDRMRSEHEGVLARLKEGWRVETERLSAALDASREESASLSRAIEKLRAERDSEIQALKESQAAVLQEVERGHEEQVSTLTKTHDVVLGAAEEKANHERSHLLQVHTEEKARLQAEHQAAISAVNSELIAAHETRQLELEEAKAQRDRLVVEERERLQAALADLERQHAAERETLQKRHELLAQEAESHRVAAKKASLAHEESRQEHEKAMGAKASTIESMQTELKVVADERDQLQAELNKMRQELTTTHSEQSKLIQEASKRQSLVDELEKHRSELAETQEMLQRVRDEKDTLQTEKLRQDSVVRELQAQITRSTSPPNVRPMTERFTRSTAGLSPMKLPPPTPPPSVPPPPAPRQPHVNGDHTASTSSQASSMSMSSKDSQLESPTTSSSYFSTNGHTPVPDAKVTTRLEQQAKQIEEQEAMIKTLNKQLTHCESDLQTHMDLVTTLETSLGESEKNLRKARMHATELARERDTLNVKLEALRNELTETKREVASVRKSVAEEKQSLEQRLDEERRAKERVRAQLDSRVEELQRRKSKFACL